VLDRQPGHSGKLAQWDINNERQDLPREDVRVGSSVLALPCPGLLVRLGVGPADLRFGLGASARVDALGAEFGEPGPAGGAERGSLFAELFGAAAVAEDEVASGK
jgi:hypothetical protein